MLAPDEPASRAAFEAAQPDAMQRRKELLSSLTVTELAFSDDDEEVADEDVENEDENEESHE